MYSYEERIRAVKLYIKLGKRLRATILQLGYPTKNSLIGWYREYERDCDLQVGYARLSGKCRRNGWAGHCCIVTKNASTGSVDIGEKLGLPLLPKLPIMVHTRIQKGRARAALTALVAALKSSVRG
jgi:hypothetical protein